MTKTKNNVLKLLPMMFAFFAMGFVDMVGIATNYVKEDFALSDTVANFLPSMVFFWFLILSVPASLMMNRIGRRKTVLVSLVVTSLALFVPVFSYNFPLMLVSFALLGIGNAIMQVSLNPLVSCVVNGDKLASTLTFGQFVKAIASFIAPFIASWAALQFDNWKLLFPIFMAIALMATVFMGFSRIEEEAPKGKSTTFFQCLGLLGTPTILMLFLGIVAHVGIDVGINTAAPKIIMERLGKPLSEAGVATSIYFLFRTLGCLSGSFILAKWKQKYFFLVSVCAMVLSMIGLFVCNSLAGLYVAIALVGFGNSNIFPMIFSKALLFNESKSNELSGLMIMGLIGGTIFPLLMGVASDALGSQIGSVIVISVGVIYLVGLTVKFFKEK